MRASVVSRALASLAMMCSGTSSKFSRARTCILAMAAMPGRQSAVMIFSSLPTDCCFRYRNPPSSNCTIRTAPNPRYNLPAKPIFANM